MMQTNFSVIMADVFQMTGNVILMMIVEMAVTRRRNGAAVSFYYHSCLGYWVYPVYFQKGGSNFSL